MAENEPFYPDVERIPYLGPDTDEPLAYRWYDADRVVAGRTMAEHLRLAVCYWHSFNWPGHDIFGEGTLDRPWLAAGGDPMAQARHKMGAAFETFEKLGTPFFTFHDRDIAPAGQTFKESCANVDAMVDEAAAYMERTGVRLLWGTANLFWHPRFAAGAATNPNPEVFAHAAAQVKHCLEATHRLGGANYVLWGGREGYETLLNTDLRREDAQLARFFDLVVEHKHRIGFPGTLLIEPKPAEPTKHQYDRDAAAVHAFLLRHDLLDEVKLNLEANHATLGGLSFHHEVAYSIANGLLGSIDANRGDPQNGWDTDQFPNSVEELSLVLYEVLKGGGLTTGGFNFDTKLRRQSVDRTDLLHAHIGGIDTLAKSLLVAVDLLERRSLLEPVEARYAGWDGELGRRIMDGASDLADLYDVVAGSDLDPPPVSGRQELLENVVNHHVHRPQAPA